MNAQITAITNQKGGVGKTTTTVNLGVGLAREGKKVLLVDGDPQGSLTISMGIQDPDSLMETLSTLMLAEMEDKPIPPDYGIIHHSEGVDLLPGNIELSGVELSLVNTMSRELVLRNVLNRLRSSYDYILIDAPPTLGGCMPSRGDREPGKAVLCARWQSAERVRAGNANISIAPRIPSPWTA